MFTRPAPPAPLAVLAAALVHWLAVVLGFSLAPAAARADAIPPPVARALTPRAGWPVRWPRAPLLDRVREASGATIAWERFGTLGEGATVCVVDTGVDLEHDDFRDAEGNTRVAWLVDLEGAPRGERPELEARAAAAIWSRASIDAALRRHLPTPADHHGHGTAVASVAAGDGAGIGEREPGPLAGVAPRASLIVVRALRTGALGFEDPDLALGVELCFALADDPARTVALLALGGHDGAHDGSEPLERALAAIARRGHAIVAAAGNDGSRPIHASGRGLPGAPARIVLRVPSPRDVEEPFVALAVRARGRVLIDGLEARPGQLVDARRDERRVLIDARAPDAIRVVLLGAVGGDWDLAIDGGPFDAWIVDARLGAALGGPVLEGDHVTVNETVAIPATEPSLIAVGAMVSRAELGELRSATAEDGSALRSARGPSAAGRARPDLVAPGGIATAALSSDLLPDDATNLVGGSRPELDRRRIGADRIAVEGSSVAAAVLAGAHALAYALAPADPARDRALLLATAASAQAWTPSLGAGALRIERWLEARGREDALGPVDPSRSALALGREVAIPHASDVVVIARLLDAQSRPVRAGEIAVVADGRTIARAGFAHGFAQIPVAIEAPAGARVAIEARADGVSIGTRTLEVRIDEGPRGLARAAGGGCAIAVARRGASRWTWLAAMCIALLARARRDARRTRAAAAPGSPGSGPGLGAREHELEAAHVLVGHVGVGLAAR